MYVIREVLHCKPGKVREMVAKFRTIAAVMKETGLESPLILTDVSGDPFWTIVAEVKVDTIDNFFAKEKEITSNETLRKAMADYHELVDNGRREIYRIET
jgi:hypothetical protein